MDTAGAIARALERVYRQGFEDAQTDRPTAKLEVVPEEGPFEWAMIPPRPRTAFWSICLFCRGRGDRPDGGGYRVPETTERGMPGWRLVAFNDRVLRDNQNHACCDNQTSLTPMSVVQRKLHPGIMMFGRQADVKPGPLGPRLWRLRA